MNLIVKSAVHNKTITEETSLRYIVLHPKNDCPDKVATICEIIFY